MAATDTIATRASEQNRQMIIYEAQVRFQVNMSSAMPGLLGKNAQRLEWNGQGRYFSTTLKTANGFSIGNRPEGGQLPVPRQPTHVQTQLNPAFAYTTLRWTGPAQAASSSGGVVGAPLPQSEMDDKREAFVWNQARKCYGTPEDILVEAKTVTAGVAPAFTILIKSQGDTISNASGYAPPTTMHLRVPMFVVWGDYTSGGVVDFNLAAPTAAGYGYITGLTTSSSSANRFKEFTINKLGGADPVSNNIFVLGDATAYGSHSFNCAENGLAALIKNGGSLHGVSSTTYPSWNSENFQNPSAPGTLRQFDENVLFQVCAHMQQWAPGQRSRYLCLMHITTFDAYVQWAKAQGYERYTARKLATGWEVVSFMYGDKQVDLVKDQLMVPYKAYFFDSKAIAHGPLSEFDWSPPIQIPGLDGLHQQGKMYLQNACTSRASAALISDLATATYGLVG